MRVRSTGGRKKCRCAKSPDQVSPGIENVQFVEEVLSRLAAINPRLRSVIEMRVFEGLTGDEIAQQLGCSPRTVANFWTFGKRWLAKELAGAAVMTDEQWTRAWEIYATAADLAGEERRSFLALSARIRKFSKK